ncbi:MAG TPA: hypothetical protein VGG39_03645 [Polyangiaceae bacterium]
METIGTRLQESGHQFVKQGDAFVVRTRDAGVAFLGETRNAGIQLFGAVRLEARRWRKFATQRATRAQATLRTGLSLPTVERVVLTQVDGTLKAIDAVVRARLAELERKPASTPGKKPRSSKAQRTRKTKTALPPIAA